MHLSCREKKCLPEVNQICVQFEGGPWDMNQPPKTWVIIATIAITLSRKNPSAMIIPACPEPGDLVESESFHVNVFDH